MTPRRNRPSLAANPVLIGAATTLVLLVGVFLAYNANNGLPFVPSYTVHVRVPDAAELVVGNEVRIGGSRVGIVKKIEAISGRRRPTAQLELSLEKAVEPLSSTTRVVVRQRSNLGLKYVELQPRPGGRDVPPGGTIGLARATPIVDLDDALSAFDAPTRKAVADLATNLGTGTAGRAGDLSRSLQDAPDALRSLEVVARTLAAPATRLVPFIDGAYSAAAAIAPVAGQLGDLVTAGATTFRAIGDEQAAVARTLDVAPEAEARAGEALAALQPVLAQARTFLASARPGLRVLPRTAAQLSGGLGAAGPVLARSGPLTVQVGRALVDLRALSQRPSTAPALRRTTRAIEPLVPALRTIAPMQTRCNYLGLWGRNVPSVVSEGDSLGTWFRFTPIAIPEEMLRSAGPSPNLHADTKPDTGAGGTCEPGNQVYAPGQQVGPAPGPTADHTEATSPPAQTTGGAR